MVTSVFAGTVALTGTASAQTDVGFGKSDLQGFGQGSLTALEFGPDGRLYVSKQNGVVYALEVSRDGQNSYSVDSQEAISAIQDIPNHDDNGNIDSGESTRQVTGLTVGGTAAQPVVYVSSSDPTIDVGQVDDDTDTNSGAISRLTLDWNDDGSLANVDHDVMVLGLPRSEENHATNGLDLSDDGNTLYVAQGGHTNQGAPSNNFGYSSEYALSGAVLSVDLAQINNNHQEKNLQSYDSNYPDVDFLYGIPTIQNDDSTDGDDLPFGGNDGVNQAKWVENGLVQVHSSGYRNPYDLVLSENDQLYAIDNGPNGGWGGQPVGEGPNGVCTNEPNDPGSGTGDQLHLASEGSYAGHPAPIRANPTGADIYDPDGNMVLDITESNSPVPASKVNPVECDYQNPSEDNSLGNTFGWTGGMDEYTASNFGGAMQGDLLVVEGSSSVERVQLNDAGDGVTSQQGNFFSQSGILGIEAVGDDGPFPGTVFAARNGVTVFEPNDFGGDTGGDQCTGADDASLDEDNDGYNNAEELDAGTDPCSAASTPADFDDDGISNGQDSDDDNDGTPDTSDPFAVDPDDGTTTNLPVNMDLSETELFGENGQGWTGLMTNGQDDYQSLYDPASMTVGGAAQVLTVENVPKGDTYQSTNDQEYAFQRGFNAPDQPFTISTTVNGYPVDPQNYQGMGIYLGNGDQDNYLKLIVSAEGGSGGLQFLKEVDGSAGPDKHAQDSSVTGPSSNTELSLTIDPTTDPSPNNGVDEVAVTAEYAVNGGQKIQVGTPTAVPASWLDSSDGTAPAAGIISTSYNAGTTFDATWTDFNIDYVNPPAQQPPTADAGDDQTVEEGDQVTLDASGSSDPNGDTLGYTWTQTAGQPDGLLDFSDGEQVTFTAPDVDGDTTYTFQVEVADGNGGSDTDTVDVTVEDTDSGTPSDGEAVYRVNTGGSEVAASDGGPAWSADTKNNPSPYLSAGGDGTYSTDDSITLDSSVPSGTPASLFQKERYDTDTGEEMQWAFDVQQGSTYEVRLYFAEIFLTDSGSNSNDNKGPRQFDVNIEGETKLDDYDQYAQFGHDVGAMESFEVTPSDGTLNIDFAHVAENPNIKAIEIVKTGDGAANEDPAAAFEYTPQDPAAGDDVSFDASGSSDDGSIASYAWDFGDGASAAGANPTHAFESAGDYDVALTVTDDQGATNTLTKAVSVAEASGGEANTLEIKGQGSDSAYSFSVSGAIDRDQSKGLNPADSIAADDKSASGTVYGGTDTYVFDGDIENLNVNGNAKVFLNGEEIDPSQYDSSDKNTLEIKGQGSDSAYSFSVSEAIDRSQSIGLNPADSIADDDKSASGTVYGGTDTYVFDGDIESLNVNGNAKVFLN
ncbi:PKD domain-containing protein, partial [Halococcus agarilyticus]|uniref:PKD domain-containing protein n=1 Tax=Halococcus agarilyticus TaxID=1232219 RepID=UPI0018967983